LNVVPFVRPEVQLQIIFGKPTPGQDGSG
jgi:hypothetical protein